MAAQRELSVCLEKLRQQIVRLETGTKRHSNKAVSSGCEALDDLLPERGFCRGILVEWLSAEGVGACTLALLAAKHACSDGGMLAVFDHRRDFCPLAAVRLGIESKRILVIHADNTADHHWAIDQALRSKAVAAMLVWVERLDDRTFRRWQLAAEEGGCLAMLLRPEAAKAEPSWADVRLLVAGGNFNRRSEPYFRRMSDCNTIVSSNRRLLRIELLRCRGGNAERSLDVELDDETYRVHLLDRRQWHVAT